MDYIVLTKISIFVWLVVVATYDYWVFRKDGFRATISSITYNFGIGHGWFPPSFCFAVTFLLCHLLFGFSADGPNGLDYFKLIEFSLASSIVSWVFFKDRMLPKCLSGAAFGFVSCSTLQRYVEEGF